MKIGKRAELSKLLNSNQVILKSDGTLNAYPIMTGALCEVSRVGDAVNTKNGSARFCNDKLSLYLDEHGVSGTVIIHHKTLVYGVPKWLTYNQHRGDWNVWSKEIEIHTLAGVNKPDAEIPIRSIEPISIDPFNHKNLIEEMSEDTQFDGLLIEANTIDGRSGLYQILPFRYCQGRVVDYNNDGEDKFVVVEIEHQSRQYRAKITNFTAKMNSLIDDYENDILNRRVRIQYTSFIPGDRLENFSSPRALFIINQK